jgi:Na+/H+-dicarboxylate symporter
LFFAIFFGVAGASMGRKAAPFFHGFDTLAHIMLKITAAVMGFAPVAIFAAVSSVIALNSLGELMTYGIEMTLMQQLLMLLMLLIAFKGIAGVPRASLVVTAAILPQFNIPEVGI